MIESLLDGLADLDAGWLYLLAFVLPFGETVALLDAIVPGEVGMVLLGVLVGAVTAIFAMIIPDNDVSVPGVIGPVAFVIVFNSFAGTVLIRRGHTLASVGIAAAVGWVVNLVAVLLFIWLIRTADERINEFALLFYVTLLTVIVALFDWFHRRGPAAAMRTETRTVSA